MIKRIDAIKYFYLTKMTLAQNAIVDLSILWDDF